MRAGEGSYPWVQIKRVAIPGTGHTPSRERADLWVSDECVVPWFTLADVWQIREERLSAVTETAERLSIAGLAASAAVLHPAGTVLLSRTASVGYSAVMGTDMAVSQDYMTWTPGPELDSRFLLYALRGQRQEFARLMAGSTHKTIYMPDLLALRTPLPPVERQVETAAFLDRECAQIDELADELAEYGRQVDASWILPFEREASVERSHKRLKHFGCDLILGPFGSLLGADEYVSGGVPVINPVHLDWRGMRPDPDVAVAESTASGLQRYRLCPGDVVLARRGELGRASVVGRHENGFVCGTGSARLRFPANVLNPKFLVLMLLTEPARAHLMLTSVGSTMANLNSDALLDLSLPDWSVERQNRASSAAMHAFESTSAMAAEVAAALRGIGEYREALIAEAVTGQLDVTRPSEAQMDESLDAVRQGQHPEVLA